MYQIRQGVFETNSSSTHSLCICTKEEFEDFKNGKLLWNRHSNELKNYNIPSNYTNRAKKYYEENKTRFMLEWDKLTPDDQKNYIMNEFDKSYAGDNIFDDNYPFESLEEGWNGLEGYWHNFTTPSGDKMVAFGLYG